MEEPSQTYKDNEHLIFDNKTRGSEEETDSTTLQLSPEVFICSSRFLPSLTYKYQKYSFSYGRSFLLSQKNFRRTCTRMKKSPNQSQTNIVEA